MNLLNLLKNGKHTAIIAYVRNCNYLSVEEECALIKRGNHDEIMNYIAGHYFAVDSFAEFLKRGNLNEIRFYLNMNQIVYQGYEEELVGMNEGVAECFADYLVRQADCYDEEALTNAQIALIKSKNHLALRRYICQKALTPKAYHAFLDIAIAEDLLVYDLARHL